MTFLGWKLSTGEVVKGFQIGSTIASNGKEIPIMAYPMQHEANKLRVAIGYKGRMTPQYQK